ncbi:MAG: hypothetical protein IIT42_05165 [Clostridia bacterium]|nr:hypothetical protein [Clostridia bacterium]
MENLNHKKIIKIMAVISIIIMVLGFVCGIVVYYEISSQITPAEGGIYIDGTDVSGLIAFLGKAGLLIISAAAVVISGCIVMVQWLIYGVIRLIISIVKNSKSSVSYYDNNIM